MTDLINGAYLVSCATTGFTSLKSESRAKACWWLMVSLGLFLLVMLRVAQAGVWIDDYLRSGLHLLNWYDDRRPLQLGFILAVALALPLGFSHLPKVTDLPLTCAISAFYALAISMAIRSSSLHWTDAAFQHQIGTLSLSHLIQIVALLATSGAGLWALRTGPPERHDV